MSALSLLLASRSPRRKEILELLRIPFVQFEIEFDEIHPKDISNISVPQYLAEQKAIHGSRQHKDLFCLGADTLVFLDENILSKPTDPNQAFQMLHSLSDREHIVRTGMAIARNGQLLQSETQLTHVRFRKLDPTEIHDYIQSGEPFDKAGSYGIQGLGARFVKEIRGCYYNVMGLPIELTLKMWSAINDIQ